MRKIDFSKSAQAFQQMLPAKHRQQIAQKILSLLTDISPPGAQPLKGYDALWRLK
ncbi:MAG: hypothetical protein SFX19_04605 [Alphaproteobacteria bacterium]|nr:hypothetical protein [Alphaproteobacteria bacterium]